MHEPAQVKHFRGGRIDLGSRLGVPVKDVHALRGLANNGRLVGREGFQPA